MRQVRLDGPHALMVGEVPEPGAPGPGEALVRLRAGGICGSDLSAYRGTSPLVVYPRVLGHELLVDVLEAPDRPDLAGRRAVVEPLLPCGACQACRRGRSNCCQRLRVMGVHVDGGLADYALVGSRQLHAVPEDMPDEVAVLAEPVTVAYHAVERAVVAPGRTAVVFGAGTIGLLVAQLLLRARGCRVLSVDLDPWRLERAERIGAEPVRGDGAAVCAAVAAATAGDMADVVFEATGNAACTRLTTEVVGHAGVVVLIGWNRGPTEVDTVTLMRKELDLLGSRNSVGAFPPVLQLLSRGLVDPALLVTHRFGLGQADRALGLLDAGVAPALKVLVSPGEPGRDPATRLAQTPAP